MPAILDLVRNLSPVTPVVFTAATAVEDSVVAAVHAGAADMVAHADFDRIPSVLARALREGEDNRRLAQAEDELHQAMQLLRESQKLATVGRLTASIAHEINNPVASIMNLLYLLKDESLSTEGRQFLDIAQNELDRVVEITRQTLNFYRDTPAPVAVRPQDLVDEVVSLYTRKSELANVRLERDYKNAETVTVLPGEVRQVLSNLVANAIDAAPGGGRVRVRVRSAHSPREAAVRGVRITIADDGAGMSPEVRSRVGQPFFTTKGQSGTGLGLWVAQGIVRKYGGSLRLSSSNSGARHGTVFSLFLPTNLRPQRIAQSRADAAELAASA